MNLRRTIAIAKKESLHVIRDRRSLVMAIAIPLFLLTLFGYALTFDVDNVPLIIWDQSKTKESRELIANFSGSRYFNPNYADTDKEIVQTINRSDAIAALVIPVDFAKTLTNNQPTKIQVIVDGSDSNTAQIAMGYAEAVTRKFNQKNLSISLKRLGKSPLKPPIKLDPRIWYNPDLKSTNNIVPGLIAVIMMVISALLTSLTIAKEWERGTMEQLISTPVKVPELILGKLFPYFLIGIFDVLLIVIIGKYLLLVPLKGSLIQLFFIAMLFLVGSLSLGLTISTLAKTQLLANQLAMVTTLLPSFLLSGFITAISNMPKAIQLFTYLVPASYFIIILKGIYLKGVGIEVLYPQAILLLFFSIFMVALAHLNFKKKLG